MNAYCYTLSVEWQHKFGYNGWRTTKASKTEHVILMCRSKKCLNKRTLGRTDGIRLFTTFAVSVMWSFTHLELLCYELGEKVQPPIPSLNKMLATPKSIRMHVMSTVSCQNVVTLCIHENIFKLTIFFGLLCLLDLREKLRTYTYGT